MPNPPQIGGYNINIRNRRVRLRRILGEAGRRHQTAVLRLNPAPPVRRFQLTGRKTLSGLKAGLALNNRQSIFCSEPRICVIHATIADEIKFYLFDK